MNSQERIRRESSGRWFTSKENKQKVQRSEVAAFVVFSYLRIEFHKEKNKEKEFNSPVRARGDRNDLRDV